MDDGLSSHEKRYITAYKKHRLTSALVDPLTLFAPQSGVRRERHISLSLSLSLSLSVRLVFSNLSQSRLRQRLLPTFAFPSMSERQHLVRTRVPSKSAYSEAQIRVQWLRMR
jgi:hypothetical protein